MAHPDEPGAGAGWNRPSRIRRDGVADSSSSPAEAAATPQRWEPWLIGLAAILMVVFSGPPLYNLAMGVPNKDYSLWYQVGAAVREGIDVYPDPDSNRLFPFMYPPSAAALLGYVSYLGPYATGFLLVLVHSAAWVGAVLLSVRLATGGVEKRRNPILYIVPSLAIIALVHNTYLLGQPNLTLLTLLLAAFLCLQKGKDGWAGTLVATGAAIKAFPIMALGYLIYRRRWRASAATIVALAAWLLVAPLAFRTPAQAVRDVKVWTGGMLFTYNSNGIAQRPFRSYSYKNQSIMAMAHRLLRDVPADGETVLAKRVAAIRRKLRESEPERAREDASLDLKTMLTAQPKGRSPLEGAFEGIDADLKAAWRVNVASWDFRAVTLATLSGMAVLSLFTLAVLPRERLRTPRTDALEFSIITLLIVMFSPLSFNYAFVWMIYPMTVALHEVLDHPAADPIRRRRERAWLGFVLLLPATAIAFPLYAQAYGNLFVPAALLVFMLGWKLREAAQDGLSTAATSEPRSRTSGLRVDVSSAFPG